mgnify:CR=1 FL=1
MRINKYLSICGLCSRREADRLVEAGRVSLNGKTAENGTTVSEGDLVCVDGRCIEPAASRTYLKLYKPVGIVCTSDSREKNNVIDFVNYPARVTYAGRLDRNSEGLLLLTDDGDLIQELMRSANAHEKEYIVTLSREMTKEERIRLQNGVYLPDLGQETKECRILPMGEKTYRFILTQGLNRQIRRMCRTCGLYVRRLKRIRIASLELGSMQPGDCAELTEKERDALLSAVKQK